jgi:branched-chain amino acid transport system permease protein
LATATVSVQRARLALSGQLGSWIFFGVAIVAFLALIGPHIVQNPAFFVQILVFGVSQGAIYALIALGYTMVYGIIELINFAHGDVFTLGAFISLALFGLIGIDPAHGNTIGWLVVPAIVGVMLVTMLLNGIVNVTIERVAYRPLRHAPRLAPLITAIGMSFILEGLMFLWKGPNLITYPNLLPSTRVPIGGGATIGLKDLIVIAIAVVLVLVLTAFVDFTKLGKAMRATAQDQDAALLMGIDINRTIAATFFIGAALAAAGGMIYGFYFSSNLSFQLGFSAGLAAFTAAVLGGIGNIQGAALGALLIGLIRTFNDGYGQSQWSDVLIFAILVLVLTFRPTGLLGMQVPGK